MGDSSMTVTLTCIRSFWLVNNLSSEDAPTFFALINFHINILTRKAPDNRGNTQACL